MKVMEGMSVQCAPESAQEKETEEEKDVAQPVQRALSFSPSEAEAKPERREITHRAESDPVVNGRKQDEGENEKGDGEWVTVVNNRTKKGSEGEGKLVRSVSGKA